MKNRCASVTFTPHDGVTTLTHHGGEWTGHDSVKGDLPHAVRWFLDGRAPESVYGVVAYPPGGVTVFYRP